MKSRIEKKWDDRSTSEKVSYVFKELFLFNNDYYEKYEIHGTLGGKGGSKGNFTFEG